MNIFKTLRKPYLSLFLSLLVLFVSCDQYNTEEETFERKFNYSAYTSFNGEFLVNDFTNKSSSQEILETINEAYGTDINLPNDISLTDNSLEEIVTQFIEEGYLTQQSLYLTDLFMEKLQQTDFDTAISTFENEILSLEITDNEFIKYNNTINVIKILNEADNSFFDKSNRTSAWCAIMLVRLGASVAALGLCATLVACAGAIANLAFAVRAVDAECSGPNQ